MDELFEDYYRQQKTNFYEVTKNAETLAGFLSTLTPDRHPESWLKWLRQSTEKSETIKVGGKTYSVVPSYADAKLGGVVLGKTAPTIIPAADVWPVVLCKDCKNDCHCMIQDFMEDYGITPDDQNNFFCGFGERERKNER